MDPITAIVLALVAGATKGLTDTAEQAIKDGYGALKQLIVRKRPESSASLSRLEQEPSSPERRSAVTAELAASDLEQDSEILQKAQALLAAVKQSDIGPGRIVGVDLRDIEAANITLEDILVRGDGTAVKAQHVKAAGDFTIRGVNAESPQKK